MWLGYEVLATSPRLNYLDPKEPTFLELLVMISL